MLQSIFPRRENPLDSLFDSAVSSVMSPYAKGRFTYVRNQIPLDLIDYGDELVLTADLPGYDSSGIQVNLEKDYLKIEVTNGEVSEDKTSGKILIRERIRHPMKRQVKLSEPIDSENAESKYLNGVLEIRLPKSNKSQIKVIPVN